eukprot:5714690-Prymnesium_polylepis.1
MEKAQQPSDTLLGAPVEYHNQRLEFLGDAVLELVSSHHLYALFEADDEGALTDHRTAVVSNAMIAAFAKQLGLHGLALWGDLRASGPSLLSEPPDADKLL